MQGNLDKAHARPVRVVIALGNVAGLFGKLLPFGIGRLALLVGLPSKLSAGRV